MSNPLLAQFVAEASDLLAEVDDGLLRLESDPHDPDLINGIFRAAHTLKGSSGLFELPELTRLTHAAEDLLDVVRAGDLQLDGGMVDALLAAFDAVRGWMPTIEATGAAPAGAADVGDGIARRLRAAIGEQGPGVTATATAVVAAAAPRTLPPWLRSLPEDRLRELAAWLQLTGTTVRAFDYRPDEACFFRGEDPLHLIRQVPALDLLEVSGPAPWPAMDQLDEYSCLLRFTALTRAAVGEVDYVFRYVPDQVEVVEVEGAALQRLLDGEPEPSLPEATPAAGPDSSVLRTLLEAQHTVLTTGTPTPAGLRSAVEAALRVVDALGGDCDPGQAAGMAALTEGRPEPVIRWLQTMRSDAPDGAPADRLESGQSESRTAPGGDLPGRADDPGSGSRVLKVEQVKVDRVLDLVGELVVAKNALPFVAEAAEESGQRALARRIRDQYAVVSRVSDELQQAVMDMRMLPVATAFARLPRLVRDLSRKLGKQVRLVQDGEDTAADKDVIEVLAEPLVHLVRNSLDHGIELPADRAAAGKDVEATLLLRAFPDGDAVVVEVTDDGRGIDVARVRGKAYERGLLDEAALEALPDAEAAELIFAPGFSTAAEISDVSGRGVGMDAVRTTIERLGGRVTVDNRVGEGLTVRLRLPLTMAVSRVLLVTAGGQRFGVPLDDVVETVRVPAASVSRIADRPVLALRDDVVPLARVTDLLDLHSAEVRGDLNVLVVRTATGPLGLVVDRFHQNTDVILKPLDGVVAATPGFCGTALLGDGLVLLVLDVKEMNDRAAHAR